MLEVSQKEAGIVALHLHLPALAMAAIQICAFQLVEDPPYSPDLAPSDY